MAAISFPVSPTTGQVFAAAGSVWEWDGSAWRVIRQTNQSAQLGFEKINFSGATLVDPSFTNGYLVASDHGIYTKTFTSSTTWTVPTGFPTYARVLVEVISGGGGGAGGNAGSGGGGGGGYISEIISFFDLQLQGPSISVVVGAGGTGGTPGNGTQGGTSSFGSLLSIVGGGYGSASTGGSGCTGGGGSSGGSSVYGGDGSTNNAIATSGGLYAGGGSASTSTASAGGNGIYGGGGGGGTSSGTPGAGGSSIYGGGGGSGGGNIVNFLAGGVSLFAGNGGNGSSSSVPASAGTAPGGGGGSGSAISGFLGFGADGARGQVKVTISW